MTSQIDLCENYIFGYSISTNLLRNSSHCFVNPIPSKEFNVKGTRELYKVNNYYIFGEEIENFYFDKFNLHLFKNCEEDDWKKYSHFARPIMLATFKIKKEIEEIEEESPKFNNNNSFDIHLEGFNEEIKLDKEEIENASEMN
uniref:Uncharacterized protein n=1 Tax=Meloidogyne floridensis TaxID=298350 RepID=A0A915NT18_9BILA